MSCPQNFRLASRVTLEKKCLTEPLADQRESERKDLERRLSRDPERRADERKARHAAGSVEREGDGQERAQRVGDHIDGREVERIYDVTQENSTVVE